MERRVGRSPGRTALLTDVGITHREQGRDITHPRANQLIDPNNTRLDDRHLYRPGSQKSLDAVTFATRTARAAENFEVIRSFALVPPHAFGDNVYCRLLGSSLADGGLPPLGSHAW